MLTQNNGNSTWDANRVLEFTKTALPSLRQRFRFIAEPPSPLAVLIFVRDESGRDYGA